MNNSTYTDWLNAVQMRQPRVAIVLGSGLGDVPFGFVETQAISFADVPGMVATTVAGHTGTIRVGTLNGQALLIFRGRLHFYEGHPWSTVSKPIELAASWGIRTVMLTNAAGGIHPDLNPGDLMVIANHRYWQVVNSWKQPLGDSLYSARINELIVANEDRRGRLIRTGIYTALTGPCYETPAEIRMLQSLGDDAVGMSTAYEAMTANALGLEVFAISSITNKAAGLSDGPLDHNDVLANATKPAERLSEIIADLLPKL